MSHLISARYEHGQAAYRAGKSIAYLVEVAEEIDKIIAKTEVEHREKADALPSLIVGFVDGFLADFRKLVEPEPLTRQGSPGTRPAGPR